mmetsp:Transcript_16992/g.25667  ORF Transcript_16992/g.25667 Transcript_16992/m.25667 type:complete len:82 (+) Transcript_16992:312-557(+)
MLIIIYIKEIQLNNQLQTPVIKMKIIKALYCLIEKKKKKEKTQKGHLNTYINAIDSCSSCRYLLPSSVPSDAWSFLLKAQP